MPDGANLQEIIGRSWALVPVFISWRWVKLRAIRKAKKEQWLETNTVIQQRNIASAEMSESAYNLQWS